jgi:hypothetical protein
MTLATQAPSTSIIDPDGVLAREKELSTWYFTGQHHRRDGMKSLDVGIRAIQGARAAASYLLGYAAIDREAPTPKPTGEPVNVYPANWGGWKRRGTA